jgi:hypothetical protein
MKPALIKAKLDNPIRKIQPQNVDELSNVEKTISGGKFNFDQHKRD